MYVYSTVKVTTVGRSVCTVLYASCTYVQYHIVILWMWWMLGYQTSNDYILLTELQSNNRCLRPFLLLRLTVFNGYNKWLIWWQILPELSPIPSRILDIARPYNIPSQATYRWFDDVTCHHVWRLYVSLFSIFLFSVVSRELDLFFISRKSLPHWILSFLRNGGLYFPSD